VFTPADEARECLEAGQVGYIIAGIKELQAAKVGDTVTLVKTGTGGAAFTATEPLPGFKEIQPQVFAGLYPTEANQYDSLRDALEKLKLNDASLHYEPEVSQALGFGFRCGFLGLLHMEIVQQRLEREFDQDLITTAPSVVYQVLKADGEMMMVENPSKIPDQGKVAEIREPIVTVHLYMPQEYVGPVMTLANHKRGVQLNMAYHGKQVMLTYEMPLGEIVLDFFDKLKSVSRGYASMDYAFKEFRASDVVKVDILLNGEKVDALSIIVHRSQAQYRGRAVVAKMREIISRQMFDVAIQAAIGANIIARETIKALRKNVLAKCYGGDITRKRKLLKNRRQARKNEADRFGRSSQEAFLAILQVEEWAPALAVGAPRGAHAFGRRLVGWRHDAGPRGASPATPAPGTWAMLRAISRCCCSWQPWSPASIGWPSGCISCRSAERRGSARSEHGAAPGRPLVQGHHTGGWRRGAEPATAADAALVAGLDCRALSSDPGGFRVAVVPVRAVQDSLRFDDPDAAGGRPGPGRRPPTACGCRSSTRS
jgi:hypothetical protein